MFRSFFRRSVKNVKPWRRCDLVGTRSANTMALRSMARLNLGLSNKEDNFNQLFASQKRGFLWNAVKWVGDGIANAISYVWQGVKAAGDYSFNSVSTTEPPRSSEAVSKTIEKKEKFPKPEFAGFDLTEINVALVGNSGQGKSSFVNALLSLEGPNAARTGVTETTGVESQIKAFKHHAGNKSVSFWDLPGQGTVKYPLDQYIRRMGLHHFDVICVISATRFLENDSKLIADITRESEEPPPIFLIRTKFDMDLENHCIDTNIDWSSMTPDERENLVNSLIGKIKQSAQKELPSVYEQIKDRMFVVSSRERALTLDQWKNLTEDFFVELAQNRRANPTLLKSIKSKFNSAWDKMSSFRSQIFNFSYKPEKQQTTNATEEKVNVAEQLKQLLKTNATEEKANVAEQVKQLLMANDTTKKEKEFINKFVQAIEDEGYGEDISSFRMCVDEQMIDEIMESKTLVNEFEEKSRAFQKVFKKILLEMCQK